MCLFASKQSVVLPLSQCDTKAVESTFRECEVGKCEYKLIQKWGKVGCDKATEQMNLFKLVVNLIFFEVLKALWAKGYAGP